MSYFAKPNFIVYDEWFDEDLEKKKLYLQIKKTNPTSYVHQFFYDQANYKIGASENYMQLDIKKIKKELIFNNLYKISENFASKPYKKSTFMEKFLKSILKISTKQKIFYSLSLFIFIIIFGYIIYFTSQSKNNESNVSLNYYSLEQEF